MREREVLKQILDMFIRVTLFTNNGSLLKVTVIRIKTIFLVNKAKNPWNYTQNLIGINKGKKENQSLWRSGRALRNPGSWNFQNSRQGDKVIMQRTRTLELTPPHPRNF